MHVPVLCRALRCPVGICAWLVLLLLVESVAHRARAQGTPAPSAVVSPAVPTSAAAPTVPVAPCVSVHVRPEVRQLAPDGWLRFVRAVQRLNAGAHPTAYDKLVKPHADQAKLVLNGALFFPFRRQFLRAFEQALQAVDPLVTLPYWNWSEDALAPERSPVLGPAYLGGNGVAKTHAVLDGAFAGWQVGYPQPHALTRAFNNGARLGPFHSAELLSQLLVAASSTEQLRRGLEYAPAGTVHNSIGGDMATYFAPNDPLFWLHAAFLDKLWSDWQAAHPTQGAAVDGILPSGQAVTLDTPIPGYAATVRSVLDTESLCYRY